MNENMLLLETYQNEAIADKIRIEGMIREVSILAATRDNIVASGRCELLEAAGGDNRIVAIIKRIFEFVKSLLVRIFKIMFFPFFLFKKKDKKSDSKGSSGGGGASAPAADSSPKGAQSITGSGASKTKEGAFIINDITKLDSSKFNLSADSQHNGFFFELNGEKAGNLASSARTTIREDFDVLANFIIDPNKSITNIAEEHLSAVKMFSNVRDQLNKMKMSIGKEKTLSINALGNLKDAIKACGLKTNKKLHNKHMTMIDADIYQVEIDNIKLPLMLAATGTLTGTGLARNGTSSINGDYFKNLVEIAVKAPNPNISWEYDRDLGTIAAIAAAGESYNKIKLSSHNAFKSKKLTNITRQGLLDLGSVTIGSLNKLKTVQDKVIKLVSDYDNLHTEAKKAIDAATENDKGTIQDKIDFLGNYAKLAMNQSSAFSDEMIAYSQYVGQCGQLALLNAYEVCYGILDLFTINQQILTKMHEAESNEDLKEDIERVAKKVEVTRKEIIDLINSLGSVI